MTDTSSRKPAEQSASAQSNPWETYGWLMAVVWMVFLWFPARDLAISAVPPPLRILGWAGLVAFAVTYLVGFTIGMRGKWHRPSRTVLALFWGAVLSIVITVPALGWDSLSFLPFLMAYSAYGLGGLWQWAVNAISFALMALGVGFALADGTAPAWGLVGIVAMMAVVNAINTWLIGRSVASDQLRLDLATSEERESVARDVHDLLGHSLTVVKLKAELAMRLIEKDPGAARAELEEIARLTSEAIAGVRGTVTGLRTQGLSEQLRASCAALESSGVTVTVTGDPAALSPAQSLPAAWILREATTNVLRHARARRVGIAFGPGTVVIEDDGVGAGDRAGNGLRGMAERASASGATLRIGPSRGSGAGGSSGTVVSLTW